MIAMRPDPADGGISPRALYVALMFARQLAEWRPVGEYENPMDAARACVRAFGDHWQAIATHAETLRAMAEHPALEEFHADGIDGPALARAVLALLEAIDVQNENVARMLDTPTPDDAIRIHGTRYRVNPATGEMEMAPESYGPIIDADRYFIDTLRTAIDEAPERTGHPVTRRGFDTALLLILAFHPADFDPDALYIAGDSRAADRLFERIMASAIYRVHQRTREFVSLEGIERAATFARGVREAIARQDGRPDGVVLDVIEDGPTPRAERPESTEGARVIPFVRADGDEPANDNGHGHDHGGDDGDDSDG